MKRKVGSTKRKKKPYNQLLIKRGLEEISGSLQQKKSMVCNQNTLHHGFMFQADYS